MRMLPKRVEKAAHDANIVLAIDRGDGMTSRTEHIRSSRIREVGTNAYSGENVGGHSLWRIAKWPSRPCFPVHIHERESTPDRRSPAFPLGAAADFHRKEASRVRDFQFALAISGISEARTDILLREIREFPQNISVRHSAGQVFQHVIHGDAQPADARLTATFAGLDHDDVGVRHTPHFRGKASSGQLETLVTALSA